MPVFLKMPGNRQKISLRMLRNRQKIFLKMPRKTVTKRAMKRVPSNQNRNQMTFRQNLRQIISQ